MKDLNDLRSRLASAIQPVAMSYTLGERAVEEVIDVLDEEGLLGGYEPEPVPAVRRDGLPEPAVWGSWLCRLLAPQARRSLRRPAATPKRAG